MNEITAKATNKKKRTCANPANVLASPEKPNTAATTASAKKMMVQYNMVNVG